jgi:hypothetical protein
MSFTQTFHATDTKQTKQKQVAAPANNTSTKQKWPFIAKTFMLQTIGKLNKNK